jgi:hypothetical protein
MIRFPLAMSVASLIWCHCGKKISSQARGALETAPTAELASL